MNRLWLLLVAFLPVAHTAIQQIEHQFEECSLTNAVERLQQIGNAFQVHLEKVKKAEEKISTQQAQMRNLVDGMLEKHEKLEQLVKKSTENYKAMMGKISSIMQKSEESVLKNSVGKIEELKEQISQLTEAEKRSNETAKHLQQQIETQQLQISKLSEEKSRIEEKAQQSNNTCNFVIQTKDRLLKIWKEASGVKLKTEQ
ncbi:uncharacterized protein LOC132193846 [Neocloeon triangulifer]|uniref:uncharacterized protein LOC132193846 n=1 Tax=Neocloeon triangulifer TaxID=2078957 RepID=UPI00286EC99E|nr:uncharacterized protein LOC132193846 [Neocloeon triangulifer]XP_059470752.1 uncharacterized protein LOC132193846 [Neocloeon triangulifer]